MILFLFNRLSLPPFQRQLLKIFTIISAITFVAVILTISFGCRPFHLNWGTIPYPPPQCTSRTQNFYTASILNIITDAAILSIALPLLWNLRVPLPRKIALILLLCSGIFVISAALIALLMSLLNATSTLNTNLWATREETAGILAVNASIIKPMFHRSFWRKDFDPHKAPRPRPVLRRPLAIDTVLETDLEQPPQVRRLGLLSSVRSDHLSGISTQDKSVGGTEEGASSRQKAISDAEEDLEVVQASFCAKGRGNEVDTDPPFAAERRAHDRSH